MHNIHCQSFPVSKIDQGVVVCSNSDPNISGTSSDMTMPKAASLIISCHDPFRPGAAAKDHSLAALLSVISYGNPGVYNVPNMQPCMCLHVSPILHMSYPLVTDPPVTALHITHLHMTAIFLIATQCCCPRC